MSAKSIFKKIQSKLSKQNKNKDFRVTKGGIKYEIIASTKTKQNCVRVIGALPDVAVAIIPPTFNKIPVEIIAKGAFKDNTVIKEVVLPEHVRIVGSEAFKNCSSLEKIEMPGDLEVINRSCFENCTALETAILPYEVKRIEANAFKNCKKLSNMFHYVKTGIGANPVLDKSLTEDNLPSGLVEIQENAFANCEAIKQAYIPYGVEEIRSGVFKGCKALKDVFFHSKLKSIHKDAFTQCASLKSIKLPPKIKCVDKGAFDNGCTIRCYEGTADNVLKSLSEHNIETIKFDPINVDSKMIPGKTSGSFYSEEDLALAVETYELRTPVKEVFDHNFPMDEGIMSRYKLVDGTYHYEESGRAGHAKILMTGDLMCRRRQIKAGLIDGVYNFDEEFDHVREILKDSDLTIGNMESMVSNSYVYSDKARFVDDRVHLNTPDAFLNSVRKAGYDVVINAQNHAYDTGTKGVYETLNVQNQQQLMHTGMFASDCDKRYISLNINGIKVAIVSYFDQARQAMKRVNYTRKGLDTIYSNFYEEQIKEDIENARKDGAEFVIAYCHWGREYTDEITEKQEGFAYMVANAGADYLMGSHSHCLQPYEVLKTDDGREVPVLYSGGNFLSDMSIRMPIVRDTIIAELELYRNEEGKVVIKSEGYHPCLIKSGGKKVRGDMYTIPIAELLKKCTKQERAQFEEDHARINSVVGRMERFKSLL